MNKNNKTNQNREFDDELADTTHTEKQNNNSNRPKHTEREDAE